MAKKSQARQWAEELCSKFPDTPNLTLAKRLAKDHPEAFTVESARSIIRLIRGQLGSAKRSQATQLKPPGKAGQLPPLPPSLAQPWKTFDIKGKMRCGVISDIHSPYHSDMALETALEWLAKHRIDTLIINGDFADFYGVSRWDRNPERVGMKRELEIVDAMLSHIRKRFSKVRIIYKAGDVDEKMDVYIQPYRQICSDLFKRKDAWDLS